MKSRPRFPFHSSPKTYLLPSQARPSHLSLLRDFISPPPFLSIADASTRPLSSPLSSLVRISLISSFYQAARFTRTRARGQLSLITTRTFHSHRFLRVPGLQTIIMSSSEDDVPLVRANGRANRKSSLSDLSGICTPSALIRLPRTRSLTSFDPWLWRHSAFTTCLLRSDTC